MRLGESGFNRLGSQGLRARVILVLRQCILDEHAVLLVLPAFDDTGSLASPPRRVVYSRGFHIEYLPPVSLQGIGRMI